MRGEILHYDHVCGIGYVRGEDGKRYRFAANDFPEVGSGAVGARVAFTPGGDTARDISPTAEPKEAFSYAPPVSPPIDRSLSIWGYFWACLTSRYATFSGRARRMEFWSFTLLSLVLNVGLAAIGYKIGAEYGSDEYDRYALMVVFFLVADLALLVPSTAVFTRRVHDIGLSGWFALLFIVLSFFSGGIIIVWVVALIRSQPHDNRWGPMPAHDRPYQMTVRLDAAGA